jgi:hypothetical protein
MELMDGASASVAERSWGAFGYTPRTFIDKHGFVKKDQMRDLRLSHFN